MSAGFRLINRDSAPAVAAGVALALGILQPQIAAADLSRTSEFNIAPQPLRDALLQYSQQSGVQVTSPDSIIEPKSSPGVSGEFDSRKALEILLKGTELVYEVIGENTITIRSVPHRASAISATATSVNMAASTIRLVQAEKPAGIVGGIPADAAGPREETSDQRRDASNPVVLQEIIVTGSHIRGVENFSSPILRFDRKDIEASGYSTTQQFIQSLPQNLSTVSDTTLDGVNSNVGMNTYNGTGANLRGLGSDATLVLINGRRLAPSGKGNYIDLSLIPLSAVERIDVLTDGASALYGSDAVGGVVNFILKRDFQGAETRLRYGTVTKGGHREWQAGQSFGHSWETGHALLSYEHHRTKPLASEDRDFIRPTEYFQHYDVTPEQTRDGALVTFSQLLAENLEISSDLFYGKRSSAQEVSGERKRSEVDSYGASLGMTIDAAGDWQIGVTGLYAGSEASERSHSYEFGNQTRLSSIDLLTDGPLADAPGGLMHLAIGGQARNEQLTDTLYPVRMKRDITSAYAELSIPWVGARNASAGLRRLEVSLAARYEDYSDFGSTFNPKLGLAWSPVEQLNVRATVGSSFKAPLLTQMNPADRQVTIIVDGFPDSAGDSTGMMVLGSGIALGPEESTNWTVGFDLLPAAITGFELSATYFRIDYDERVRYPLPSGYSSRGVLLDPAYSLIVERAPGSARILELLQGAGVTCYTFEYAFCAEPPTPDEIDAIVDLRLRNLANVRMSGVDFLLGYGWKSLFGEWNVSVNGSYLLDNSERLTSASHETNQMNDVWRPVDMRLRGGLSHTRGNFSAAAYLNYVDGYEDRRNTIAGPLQRKSVSSWTTVDLTFLYQLQRAAEKIGLSAGTLALSASNVLDRDPPFAAHLYGINFDGVNANPLGRFVSLQLTTRW